MGLFSRFRKQSTAGEDPDKLGSLMVQVAVYECEAFQKIWECHLGDQRQVDLFAELVTYLGSIADRLAFEKFGDPSRTQIMHRVLNTLRSSFANQRHYGPTTEERIKYFDDLFWDRFEKYGKCSSIMGEDSLLLAGASHLTKTFLKDIHESTLQDRIVETGKELTEMTISILMTDPFKAISR